MAALLMMVSVVGKTQDTVWITDMRSFSQYMMSPSWPSFPEAFDTDDNWKKYCGTVGTYGYHIEQTDANAIYMFSDDTITVYGVASALTNLTKCLDFASFPEYVDLGDTSTENAYTWLMLYEAESDSLRQLVDTAPMYVHTRQQPQYYLQFDLWQTGYTERRVPTVSMYERFFPTPVDVVDSFYVGFVHRKKEHTLGEYADMRTNYLSAGIYKDTLQEQVAFYSNWSYTDSYSGTILTMNGWGYGKMPCGSHLLVFPIIAPPDTTSGSTDSTLVIQPTDLVYRYTNVAPNPANDKVRVSSSFGITAIEAFNASGANVYRGEFDGMVASIDVSAWPRGTYLLRITTRNGTTVKKLVVP